MEVDVHRLHESRHHHDRLGAREIGGDLEGERRQLVDERLGPADRPGLSHPIEIGLERGEAGDRQRAVLVGRDLRRVDGGASTSSPPEALGHQRAGHQRPFQQVSSAQRGRCLRGAQARNRHRHVASSIPPTWLNAPTARRGDRPTLGAAPGPVDGDTPLPPCIVYRGLRSWAEASKFEARSRGTRWEICKARVKLGRVAERARLNAIPSSRRPGRFLAILSVPAGARLSHCAEVAELADALASGASGRKPIGVQIPASAPTFARLRVKRDPAQRASVGKPREGCPTKRCEDRPSPAASRRRTSLARLSACHFPQVSYVWASPENTRSRCATFVQQAPPQRPETPRYAASSDAVPGGGC